MVLNIVVFPMPEGPSKETISPCFSTRFTLLTLFFSLANKLLRISKNFQTFFDYISFFESIYLDDNSISIVDQNIRKSDGKAAASNKS